MTIGKDGDLEAFKVSFYNQTLSALRIQVAEKYGLEADKLELSMGMSADFYEAIGYGASIVRVGSSIFGARNYGQQ